MLKKIRVENAIGMTLAHDITKVIPGEYKGPVFRRGHIITDADIDELKSIGKEHVYIMELAQGEIHEEEAAFRIARAISGKGLELTGPSEGRVNMVTQHAGLLKIDIDLLTRINSIGDIIISTLHNNRYCQKGTMVAATKIIPLFTEETKVVEVEKVCRTEGKVIDLIALPESKVGMVITGNEVFKGIREDAFYPVMSKKIEKLGSSVVHKELVPDDIDAIARAILDMKTAKCDVILVCGGLSIDPDDVTRQGIIESGACIISYGAPVMPGAMFLVADLESTPLLGVPGAAIYNPTTVLDLILPRVLAGEKIQKKDIIDLAHGGLCLNCKKCVFPLCHYGK